MPELRTKIASLVLAAGLVVPALAGAVPIDMDGPTTGLYASPIGPPPGTWLAIGYPPSVNPPPDWPDDQAGGGGINLESDIVGDAANPAFYTAFDDAGTAALTDGMLGFRVRIGTNHTGNPDFNRVAAVGIDANLDGALDVFVVVDNPGGNQIRLYNADPAFANDRPTTTSITSVGGSSDAETPANYAWNAVTIAIDPSATTFDVDGGGLTDTDHFLSFGVAFQEIVGRLDLLGITGVDQNTEFQYVLGTATAATGTLNRDLAGPSGSTTNPLFEWGDPSLGAMSNRYPAGAGVLVPEPGTGLSLGLGLLGLGLARRRLRHLG